MGKLRSQGAPGRPTRDGGGGRPDGGGGRFMDMARVLAIVVMAIAVGLRREPSPTTLSDAAAAADGGDSTGDDIASSPRPGAETGATPPLPALPEEIGGLSPSRVRTTAWTDTTDISKLLTRPDAAPLILTDSPTKLWPARLWTPAGLAELEEVLPSVHEHFDRRFRYFDGTKPLAKQDGKLQPPYRTSDVPANKFFGERFGPSPVPGYAYFSHDLDLPPLQALRRDVRPLRQLTVDGAGAGPGDGDDDGSGASADRRVFVWAGSANASAPFHYDTSHNCYAQIYGRKRFYLLPPADHEKLYLHSVHHPSDRQSQVAWEPTPDWILDGRFPAFHGVTQVLVADIEPGDLLLIPAHWFHFVVAVTASISVNVWSLSSHARAFSGLLSDAIPLYQASWPLDKLIVLLQWYVPAVIVASLRGSVLCNGFFADGSVLSDAEAGVGCADLFLWEHIDQKFSAAPRPPQPDHACSASSAKNLQAVLGDQVAAKAAVFKAMPEPVRIMYLQVWVEHLAGFAAGEKGVEHFVADCLCRDCTDKADGDG